MQKTVSKYVNTNTVNYGFNNKEKLWLIHTATIKIGIAILFSFLVQIIVVGIYRGPPYWGQSLRPTNNWYILQYL